MKKKAKIGRLVKWYCKPFKGDEFECKGEVLQIKKLNPGGKNGKPRLMAQIEVSTKQYLDIMPRKTTWISVDKLEVN